MAIATVQCNMRALWGKGQLSRVLNRPEESLRYYRAALERDPLAAGVEQGLSTTLIVAGRLAEAEQHARHALEISPSIATGHWYVGAVLLEKGNFESALAEMQRELEPAWRRSGIALAEYALGHTRESDVMLQEMLRLDATGDAYRIALVYAARGDARSAVAWLERARIGREVALGDFRNEPLVKAIRGDARFTEFLRKMNLPE